MPAAYPIAESAFICWFRSVKGPFLLGFGRGGGDRTKSDTENP
jgi:hypothetical protein